MLRVDYDGRTVEYEFGELDEVSLAYATSIHKSQGFEYPAVVTLGDAALHPVGEEPDLHCRHQRKEARYHHRSAEGAGNGREELEKADEPGGADSCGELRKRYRRHLGGEGDVAKLVKLERGLNGKGCVAAAMKGGSALLLWQPVELLIG